MFDDRSMLRRVNGESAVLLGGGRALLMQLAHPLVARGVAEHSRFQADPLRRLVRTLRPSYAVVFGSVMQAGAAASQVRASHARVQGAGYAADDPALLQWVHATLVDSALVTYERFVGTLRLDERERYYLEMRRAAALLGLPLELQPPDLAAFEAYLKSAAAELDVTDEARRLAAATFTTRPWQLAPLTVPSRWLTAGLLAPPLRAGYRLRWTALDQRLLDGLSVASRLVLPRLPRTMRRPPPFLMPRPAR